MEHSPSGDTEKTAVFRYRMPVWQALLSALVVMLLNLFAVLTWPFNRKQPLVLGRMVTAVELTNPGLEMVTPAGKLESVSWADVTDVRRRGFGLISIGTTERRRFLTAMPKRMLDSLFSILREASNARIIGFEAAE